MVNVFSDNANPSLWKVLITAKYANVNVESHTGINAQDKQTLAKTPLGKLPYLETDDNTVIYGDNAIVRYIARIGKGHLYGASDVEAGLIEQFILLSATDIDLPASVWILPILGQISNNVQATSRAKIDIQKVLGYLNKHLQTRTYLVGERLTIADICVAMSLYYLYQRVLDSNTRKGFINTNRWFNTIVNQPNIKAIIGDFTLCSKQEVASETAPVPAKKEAPKKEEAKKPAAEKPAAKKEEKPKKKNDDEEEEDEYADKEDKKPNVLDSLPPSKFIMDEWKRQYSNNDTRPVALPWFWQNLDKDGYSIWFCDYKYNNECEKVFMTCNLLGGWIQRLDKVRKYAFGSLCIFGEEPKLEVAGCWLFRGQDVPQEMKETDDYEHYDWRKADLSDPVTKALVEDYFAWDGSFGGRPTFNQGKIFK